MLKRLSICAAILAIGTGSVNAQQQAVLQTIGVPGASFDILLAMPKSQTMFYDLSESPEALVIHLVGGKLALGFEDEETMLKVLDSLRRPIGAFDVESQDGKSRKPVVVYIVPKSDQLSRGADSPLGHGQTKLSRARPFRCTPSSGRSRCTAEVGRVVPGTAVCIANDLPAGVGRQAISR